MSETVVCPKCKTETDATVAQCEMCGKFIIINELSREDQKVLREVYSKGEVEFQEPDELEPKEMAAGSNKSKEEVLSEMGDLDLSDIDPDQEVDRTSTPRDRDISEDESDSKDPFASSDLMKRIKEDEELFGDLDKD